MYLSYAQVLLHTSFDFGALKLTLFDYLGKVGRFFNSSYVPGAHHEPCTLADNQQALRTTSSKRKFRDAEEASLDLSGRRSINGYKPPFVKLGFRFYIESKRESLLHITLNNLKSILVYKKLCQT
jgi:hypothetical protein